MTYDIKAGLADINSFDVVGISMITDHTKATEDINHLWERFFQEKVGQRVRHKANDTIYAVYSDYEGDHEKPYRLTIGYRVERGAMPDSFFCVTIKDQSYAVMSATGDQPTALIDTWTAIWSSDLERSYKTDFELYGPRFFEDGVHEILVHVGV